MELDKSNPYATIHGDADGRSFEQDGVFFAVDGSEWVDPTERKSAAAKKKEAAEAAAAKAASEAAAKAEEASSETAAVTETATESAVDSQLAQQ